MPPSLNMSKAPSWFVTPLDKVKDRETHNAMSTDSAASHQRACWPILRPPRHTAGTLWHRTVPRGRGEWYRGCCAIFSRRSPSLGLAYHHLCCRLCHLLGNSELDLVVHWWWRSVKQNDEDDAGCSAAGPTGQVDTQYQFCQCLNCQKVGGQSLGFLLESLQTPYVIQINTLSLSYLAVTRSSLLTQLLKHSLLIYNMSEKRTLRINMT